MSTFKSVTVHSNLNGENEKLPFYQCVVEAFTRSAGIDHTMESKVSCVEHVGFSLEEENDVLVLFKEPQNTGFTLYHPGNCPLSQHGRLTDRSREDDNILVGAAVLLHSADGFILLTRRSKKLRTFPGVWVPAGGHLEPGESPAEAAVRELSEEVGLNLSADEYSVEPLCLFESCFPPFIEQGQPKRHHIVVYHIMMSSLTKVELNLRIQPFEAEVDACCWVPITVVQGIVGENNNSTVFKPIEMITVENGITTKNLEMDPKVLMTCTASLGNSDKERLSTGTKIALKSYMLKYEKNN